MKLLEKLKTNIKKNRFIAIAITISTLLIASYILIPRIITKIQSHYYPRILVSKSITKEQLNKAIKIAILPEEIIGEIITLRKITPKHFRAYHDMFSDKVREMIEYPKKISFKFTKTLLRYDMKKVNEGTMIMYGIFDNNDQKLIGEIEIKDPNPKNPGQLSDWINENYWGGGRFQESLDIISKVYFKYKNTDKYTAHSRLWNKRSYYAHKKYGFKDAGYGYEDGKPCKHILELENPYKKSKSNSNRKKHLMLK